MNPQFYPYILDKLFEAGSIDAWLTPIVMKKGRPAVKLSALVSKEKINDVARVFLQETSTIGLRINTVERIEADRKIVEVKTGYGKVKAKLAYYEGKLINVAPEYEDCARIAKERQIPLKVVYQEVTTATNLVIQK